MSPRNPPPTASVATPGEDGKLIAPAATRNADVLCDLLAQWAPPNGKALEIASGTGQHACAFAAHLPGLYWQPTEIDPDRRASIDAYTRGQPNVATAAELNAANKGWHKRFVGQNLIIVVNLLHLISLPETQALIAEAALALAPRARLIIYGPFMRGGELTSEGDQNFHASLVRQDPEIGYKDVSQIDGMIASNRLSTVQIVEMPANNLAIVAERPAV